MPREDREQEEEQRARNAYDLIRMRLDRLQKNIEKPVSIPQRRDTRKPRPPPDFVRNVVGSSAAAGSAEFHIFRNNRKREMDRLDYMNQKAQQEELDAEYEAKREKQMKLEEERTAKKRSKRQRYKEKLKRHKRKEASKREKDDDSDEAMSSAEHTDDDDASLSDPTLGKEALSTQSNVRNEGEAVSCNDSKGDITGKGNVIEDCSNGDQQRSDVESEAFAGDISNSGEEKVDT
uniref:PRKR-interacting protein 1 n=1 Tax=Parascaris univalens TaxID=6257 RepID=A0A915APN6_PARUN